MPDKMKKRNSKIELVNVKKLKGGWTKYDAVMPNGAIMKGKSKNTLARIKEDLNKIAERRSKFFTPL